MNDSVMPETMPTAAAELDNNESVVSSNSRRDVIFLLLFLPLLGLFSLAI